MWSKEELIKKQTLTILVIITVIFALIFLSPSQALSDKPGWKANYSAYFDGDITGEAQANWQGKSVSSQRFQADYPPYFYGDVYLEFNGSGFDVDGYNYIGSKSNGWLEIRLGRREESDRFHYTWNEGKKTFGLSSPGDFTYDKKSKTFVFIVIANEY